MVKPIILHESPSRILYGTRAATYVLSLNDKNLEQFAGDLWDSVAAARKEIGGDSYYHLFFEQARQRVHLDFGKEKSQLVEAFIRFPNVFLRKVKPHWGDYLVANFLSRFDDEDKQKGNFSRTLAIQGLSVPNDVFNFDPTFLYDLGNKYGQLTSGEDFDITVGAYREIETK